MKIKSITKKTGKMMCFYSKYIPALLTQILSFSNELITLSGGFGLLGRWLCPINF